MAQQKWFWLAIFKIDWSFKLIAMHILVCEAQGSY